MSTQLQRYRSSILAVATVCLLLLVNQQFVWGQNYTIPRSFANAVDSAIKQLVSDSEFTKGMSNLGVLFGTPDCAVLPYSRASIPDGPTVLKLPRSSLILCYEMDALLNWPKVHELAGKVLMRIMSEKYKQDIPYSFLKVNTTGLGYFSSLKSLVDNGNCDVAIASTNLEASRLPLVHFNCPYGSSSPGFFRSSLDNDTIIINSESDLDNPDITILTYQGSY